VLTAAGAFNLGALSALLLPLESAQLLGLLSLGLPLGLYLSETAQPREGFGTTGSRVPENFRDHVIPVAGRA
jgi:hypothetical protein